MGSVWFVRGSDSGKFYMLQITEVATSWRPTEYDDHMHRYPGVSN
jgi:hypothetical protein